MRLKIRYESDDKGDSSHIVLYVSCFIVLIISLALLITGLFAARKLARLQ